MSLTALGGIGSGEGPAGTTATATVSMQQPASGAKASGFSEFLDVINPLQHIPGVSHVYRALTGDEISSGARAGGNMLYGLLGGPLGMVVMTGVTIAEEAMDGRLATAAPQGGGSETSQASEAAGAEPIPSQSSSADLPWGDTPPTPTARPQDVSALRSPSGPFLGLDVARPGAPLPPVRDVSADEAPEVRVDPQAAVESLGRHGANILPLDVLAALQARYLQGAGS